MKAWLTRDRIVTAVVLLLLAGAGAWLASRIEWVEMELPTPASPEAQRNDLLALQDLARRLGAQVETPKGLAEMPPPGATLYLGSWQWDVFPGRGERLREWVDAGGQLVLSTRSLDSEQLSGWLPVRHRKAVQCRAPNATRGDTAQGGDEDTDDEKEDDEDEDSAPARDAPAPAGGTAPAGKPPERGKPALACRTVQETDATAAPGTAPRRFTLCSSPPWQRLDTRTAPSWQLDAGYDTEILRVAYGRGSVTVLNGWDLRGNRQLTTRDHGLVAAEALQLHRGQRLWFVEEEARSSFGAWLWQNAAAVLLLAGLALLLLGWRALPRFGPAMAVPPVGRRSMAEQVTGTARFLWRHGPLGLHTAQLRALDETARLHVMQYDTLERGARAAAIAGLTGLDAAALGLALDRSIRRRRIDLPPTLELLETARRRLAERAPATAS